MGIRDPNRPVQGCIFCVYGAFGIGKSMMAAAFARSLWRRTGAPVMYADWEMTYSTLPVQLVEATELWQPESTYQIDTPQGPQRYPTDPIDQAMDMAITFSGGSSRLKKPYSGLVTDTLATMMQQCLYSIVEKDLSPDPSKPTQRARVATAMRNIIPVPNQPDYGAAIHLFEKLLRACLPGLDAGGYMLWVTHDRNSDKRDKQGNVIEIVAGPEIVGSALTKSAPKLTQLTLRMEAQRMGIQTVRALRSNIHGYYFAKDRYGVIPDPLPLEISRQKPDGTYLSDVEHKELVLNYYEQIWDAVFNTIDNVNRARAQGQGVQPYPVYSTSST